MNAANALMAVVILWSVALAVCIGIIVLSGCLGAPRQAPGQWDANLRYELTHPQTETPGL